MKKLFRIFLFVGLVMSYALTKAQSYYSCDRWATYSSSGYTIYNNIWGSNYGTQCLSANAYNDWWVDANHTGTGIKSYPNVEKQVDLYVDNMGSVTSTFSVSRPGSGAYSSTYDIWYDNYAYEIMLWMNYTGDIGPISYNYGCSGYPSWACPEATNVNAGGHTWNVYRGNNGSNEVFSFIRISNTNSGTVDISAISQWLRNNGWFGNAHLHSIQFGFEITSTSGTSQFRVNNFNVTQSSSGGSGSSTFSGTYNLVASHSGKALDVYAWGTSNGTNICQWDYWGGATQQFNIASVDGEWHRITPVLATDKALDIDGVSTANGANLFIWSYWGGYGQQFRFQSAGSGVWRIIARHSGKCIDVEGVSTANGANVFQWDCISGAGNQMFQVIKVNSAEIEMSKNDFEIYPNPVINGILNLRLNNPAENSTVRILDLGGKVVLDEEINNQESVNINVEKLNGIYMLQLINNETNRVRKIFIKNQ